MSKYELTADMTENRQYWKQDDGKDWPTKKWRWSLKVRKREKNIRILYLCSQWSDCHVKIIRFDQRPFLQTMSCTQCQPLSKLFVGIFN